MFDVETALRELVATGGSDLHLRAYTEPRLRLNGELVPLPGAEALTPADTEGAVRHMLRDATKLEEFATEHEVDFSFAMAGVGRFRVNAFQQRGTCSIVARAIPFEIRTLDELQLPAVMRDIADEERGIVLVTGTTGSGKSTTLYAALGQLNTPEKNIITIEDPVEYQVDGITQVQVNPRAGLTFASGLRAMMRADPDVIMVGEIRDRETAQIAVEAALTGHLVLSTLHTNDAPTAITRLTEMGIEPFLVASAIDAVVAQRLARQLCRHCKQRTIIPADVLRRNGFHVTLDLEAYEPDGCARCNNTGYKGRIGLYEVMRLNDEIRSLAVERASADRIAEVAMRHGMYRLREDGLRKVTLGLTSIAEVARVCGTGAG